MDPTIDPGVIAIIMLISQFIGRLIPDGVGGVLGAIRRIAKTVGVYTDNRKE